MVYNRIHFCNYDPYKVHTYIYVCKWLYEHKEHYVNIENRLIVVNMEEEWGWRGDLMYMCRE